MMTKSDNGSQPLEVRALFAPAFIGLGIAAGVVDLKINSPSMVWLGLLCLTLGLVFSNYTRKSFARV